MIYGHNITGENANWITIGTTIRFPVEGAQPEHKRTGHSVNRTRKAEQGGCVV